MTVEELQIVIEANVEQALKEFQKVLPTVKQMAKQVQDSINKVDTKSFTAKVHQAVELVKQKVQNLKKSIEGNKVAIKVNTQEASKQVTQLQKEIDSLEKKINARQMKLNIINPQIDKIVENTRQEVTPVGVNPNSKAMDTTVNNSLSANKDFTSLNSQAQKLYTEIEAYNSQLSQAKTKMVELNQNTTQTTTTQSKLSSFFSAFKSKLGQAGTLVSNIKEHFKQLPGLTSKTSNNVKNISSGFKDGLKHVLKYAMALFSLRGIYSILSQGAQTWLSSDNATAKQVSANINYMKYALGSMLAPVIQFLTNLVYNLLRAIQSVAYAFSGVNIFAKATASSMKSTAKSAKDTSKSLAGVHNEINNVGGSSNSESEATTPSIDLSKMNPQNNILDAIKNGNWSSIGFTIAEKLNNAMASIPWNKIQNTVKSIGSGIAQFLNGFIKITDWKQVGNTFAQGINTIIYFGYNFITTFDWEQFGKSISDSINGFIKNIDWKTIIQTLSELLIGIFNFEIGLIENFDWNIAIDAITNSLKEIEWSKIADVIFEFWGTALANLLNLSIIIGKKIGEAVQLAKQYFQDKIQECGGNIVEGIFKGIIDALATIVQWIMEHIFKPFIEGFQKVFEIHSPSKVMEDMGRYIIQGLFNGISSLVGNVQQIWNNMKSNAINTFSNIKEAIVNKVSEIKNSITKEFQESYNSIRNIFGNIGPFFSGVWGNIRNTFSNLGSSIGNAISGSVKSGINGVISLIERTINHAIYLINGGIKLINLIPGVYVGTVGTLSLPRLAKGNVAYSATLAEFGEYAGASSNPEITTPQNVMADTFRAVLSEQSANNNQSINMTVKVGEKKLANILIDEVKDRVRQTGNDVEVIFS